MLFDALKSEKAEVHSTCIYIKGKTVTCRHWFMRPPCLLCAVMVNLIVVDNGLCPTVKLNMSMLGACVHSRICTFFSAP